MADIIQLRRDTKANWATKNPVLAIGETGLEIDTRKVKYGDGTTTWNDLPYSGGADYGSYDVSEANNGAVYATLQNALTALPVTERKGGMNIRFIDATTNSYVEYRYMAVSTDDSIFLSTGNWQGIDETPTEGSNNLVKSGSIYSELKRQDEAIERLNGNDVVVVEDHTDVENPDPQKIYREQGTDSYTDWMYVDGEWKIISIYTFPGIDNYPAEDSDNLVKSKGIHKAISDAKNDVIGNASDSYNTLGKIEDRIKENEEERDEQIENLIDGATDDYDTLGKIEERVKEESSNRDAAIEELKGGASQYGDTLKKLEERIDTETYERIDQIAESEGNLIDGASDDSNTLKKLEIKINSETSRAKSVEDTKANKATTLAGYGITDGYTKNEGEVFENYVNRTIAVQQAKIDSINGNEVIVVANHSSVSSPKTNTIYREQGTDSYTDWMYAEGVGWKKIATYDFPGMDNVPTSGSQKLLSSDTILTHGNAIDVSILNANVNTNPATPSTYNSLSEALAAVPATSRKGGMSIKFIQTTPAKYTVIKTEGATERPTGTELQSDPGIISGTYTAGELSSFSTLPATLNSSLTYYLTVIETVDEQEVTTYTTWVITYVQSSDNNYVQYRYMLPYGGNTTAENNKFVNVANWQGIDSEPTYGSRNLIESGGVHDTIALIESIGEKNVRLTDFYGYTTKGGFTIYEDGLITPVTGVNYMVVYSNSKVNKGAILHVTGSAAQSSQNPKFVVAISSVPITDDNLTTVKLTILYYKQPIRSIDSYLIVPFDGYIVYYRYVHSWAEHNITVCNIPELYDNSVLDLSELNSTSYTSLQSAISGIPTTLQKGGMEICYKQIIPATYSVVISVSDTEPAGTALDNMSTIEDGIYEASELLTDFSTLPSATGAANAVVYYFDNDGTYTIWTITMETADGEEYVKYRLMSSTWSSNVTMWQGVDKIPTKNSRNLIESGSVYALSTEVRREVRSIESDVFELNRNVFNTSLNEIDISNKILIGYTNSGVSYSGGDLYASTSYDATKYINISECKFIRYSRPQSVLSGTALGMAFYDKDKRYISGQKASIVQSISGYESTIIVVPYGAYYIRLSVNKNTESWGAPYLYNVKGVIIGESKIESLEQAVSSLDTDVEAIKDELHQPVENDLSDTPISEENKYILSSGGAVNGGTMGITTYTDCAGFETMEISVIVLTTSPSQGLAFYDINKTYIPDSFIPREQGSAKGSTIKTYNIPENAAYFRTTYYHEDEQETYGAFYCKLHKVIDTLDEIEDDVDELDARVTYLESLEESTSANILKLTQQDIVELNVIASDGDIVTSSGMGCTDYIPCKNANMLTYAQIVGNTGAGLAFYDSNKDFISGSYIDSVSGVSGVQPNTVNVPDGAEYFRASGWSYANSISNGSFFATLESPDICVNNKRASNGECTYFSVFYNKIPIDLSSNTFENPCLGKEMVCTTAVVLLPPTYTPSGKPSRVIVNFHGWSHYVNYKQWGAAGDSYAGFMIQKHRWADAGYVVIDINHKNSSQKGGYSGLGSIQDDECYRKALEWVYNNYNVEKTCFIVCGSAGGPNGINACYNWPDVRAGVWLDTWIDVSEHAYDTTCGNYYYGYDSETGYLPEKVGTRNPVTHIHEIDEVDYITMPKCPIILYPLTPSFMDPFVDVLTAGNALNGDYYIRRCTGIRHSTLVSGGDGTDPQSAVVDAEIINFLDQH